MPAKAASRSRGIYLLPNLFTTVGLFAAFYAIVSAMKGQYESAAIAVFIAMVMDGLDGRVARLTNTQSEFGGEYDSLSDMVAFGVAPALVVYSWSLSNLGKLGWLAAFIFTAAGALRLARFNTQAETTDKRYFQGLAIPAAAAVITGCVWLGNDLGLDGHRFAYGIAGLTVLIALLMVSNIRYYSFKQIDFKGRVPFFWICLVVLILVGIALHPPLVLFSTALVYAISGPLLTLWQLRQKRRHKTKR